MLNRFDDYTVALNRGRISQEQFTDLVESARKKLEKPIDVGGLKLDSLQAGSAEAIAEINKIKRESRFTERRVNRPEIQQQPQVGPVVDPRANNQVGGDDQTIAGLLSQLLVSSDRTATAIEDLQASDL